MRKLVLKSDNTIEIRGTADIIPGCALIGDVRSVDDFDYAGETEVDWDGQKTSTTRDGKRLFWSENWDLVSEDEVEMIDADN